MKKATILTASELGEYVYCKRGWYLRAKGMLTTTPAMKLGSEQHNKLSMMLANYKLLYLTGVVLIGVGIIGLILFLLSRLFLS